MCPVCGGWWWVAWVGGCIVSSIESKNPSLSSPNEHQRDLDTKQAGTFMHKAQRLS